MSTVEYSAVKQWLKTLKKKKKSEILIMCNQNAPIKEFGLDVEKGNWPRLYDAVVEIYHDEIIQWYNSNVDRPILIWKNFELTWK